MRENSTFTVALIALAALQACRQRDTRPAPQVESATPTQPASVVATPEIERWAPPAHPASVVYTPEIERLVTAIAKGNRVEGSVVGFAGMPSAQWENYQRLKDLASVAQLIALTDHENAAVRCYAFQALAAKDSDHVFDVLLKHLGDTEIVDTQSGCIVMRMQTADYFVEAVTLDGSGYKLSPIERERLGQILLNSRTIKLGARSRSLAAMKPIAGNYARVREIAVQERDPAALRLLAKYRNPADVELISTFFAQESERVAALFAAREFPDQAFYPLVTQLFERAFGKSDFSGVEWRLSYQVLAQYPRPQTLALFERTLSVKEEFARKQMEDALLTAITKYPNQLFEPLRSKVPPRSPSDANAPIEADD